MLAQPAILSTTRPHTSNMPCLPQVLQRHTNCCQNSNDQSRQRVLHRCETNTKEEKQFTDALWSNGSPSSFIHMHTIPRERRSGEQETYSVEVTSTPVDMRITTEEVASTPVEVTSSPLHVTNTLMEAITTPVEVTSPLVHVTSVSIGSNKSTSGSDNSC